MKRVERDRSRILRAEGRSINQIARELNVSKASVSHWVREVSLSPEQRQRLNSNGHSVDAIEKRRISRIANTGRRHREVMSAAKKDVGMLSERELFLIGVALYWGEGGKAGRSLARIANADPKMIQFMMRFFKEICRVPASKFRGHVNTFSHLNAQKAEAYWSKVSGIPRKQFYKTYSKPSIASKGKKDSLPNGTFQIYVCDTVLHLKILGWIEGLAESAGQTKQAKQ